MEETLRNLGLVVLGVMSVSLILALILLVIIIVQVRRIHVPPNATFAETMHYTPFLVVVFLDVLDLALDFLSAPIAWVVINKFLEKFTYKMQIGPSIFLMGLTASLLIAMLTVAYKSIRSATASPVNSLRSE